MLGIRLCHGVDDLLLGFLGKLLSANLSPRPPRPSDPKAVSETVVMANSSNFFPIFLRDHRPRPGDLFSFAIATRENVFLAGLLAPHHP